MNRCACGRRIGEDWWILYGCCHVCLRPLPMGVAEETLAETAAMLNDPDIVHNYTD